MRIILMGTLLLAASWLAINCYVFCLAEGIFAHAQPNAGALFDRATAGTLFGDLLSSWVGFVDVSFWPLLGLLLALLSGYTMHRRRSLTAGCLLALTCLIVIHAWARATVQATRELRPPIPISTTGTPAPPDTYSDDQRQHFQLMHERSKALFTAECALLLLVSLGAAVAILRRQQDVLGPSASHPSR